MKVLFSIVIICTAFLSSCYYDSQENLYPTLTDSCSDTTNVTYSGTIVPILGSRCTTCHSGSSPSGNIRLDNYAGVMVVVNNKKLLGSIKQDGTAIAMPQSGGKLDNCKIIAVSKWINAGAPNN